MAKPINWKLNIFLMWITQIFVMTGFDAAMPFIPQLLRDNFGMADQAERGVYVSIFTFAGSFAYAVFCPLWGSLSDRFGVKIMLLRGFFVTCFFYPLMGYASEPWILIALRFLTAACAGTTAAANILLVKTVPENRTGFALGVISTALWGGSVLGQVLGGIVVDLYGYKVTFWACGILYFISGVLTLFASDAHVFKKPSKPDTASKKYSFSGNRIFPRFTRGVWVLMMVMLFYCFVKRFEIPYISMLIELITGPEKAVFWTGIVGAFSSIGAFLSGFIIGYLSDRLKPQTIIVPALVISAITLLVQAFSTDLITLTVSRTLLFFFSGSLFPILQKLLSAATPQRKRGKVFGWSTTFNNTGGMLSTIGAGAVVYSFETRGIFVAAAILIIILIPVTLWGIKVITHQPFYIAHAGKK